MLSGRQLAAALAEIPLISAAGPWSRAVGYRHLLPAPKGFEGRTTEPLWAGASKIAGARFTPKGSFDSLYLAGDPITAFTEISALILLPGGPVGMRSAPWVVISIEGVLLNILDLTDAAVLERLQTTSQEMTGVWLTSPNPPTQILGRAAYDSGRICGIRYASAKNPGGINFVVFPDRIISSHGSILEVYDPHGHLRQRIVGA